MKFEPHAYQSRAIEWIKDKPRCGLFLDMGLGKTVSTLTAFRDLIDEGEVQKALVVAPKKVAESTWSTEAAKWDHLHGLRVSKVIGTARQRAEALETEADLYVIGRDSLVWLLEHFDGRFPFDFLVLDELTSFKNHQSKRFKVAKKLSLDASRVVGLTGTPVPNSLLDLWAEVYAIDMGQRLGKFIGKYRDAYFNQVRVGMFATKYSIKKGAADVILGKVSDICLTMQAKDYLTLPSLQEVTEFVDLPGNIMKGYREFEREQVAEFVSATGGDETIMAASAAGLVAKLSQYAAGGVYDEDHNVHRVHTEKTERLAEIVEAAQSPVLVFYQYRYQPEEVREALKGYKVRTYEGPADLDEWNAGRLDVLLAHPASTSYGLNMQQGGHYVVWLGTGYNLEQYQQANARLHRQGQAHPVTVYRLVARGTVDEQAAATIDRKGNAQDGIIQTLKQLLK